MDDLRRSLALPAVQQPGGSLRPRLTSTVGVASANAAKWAARNSKRSGLYPDVTNAQTLRKRKLPAARPLTKFEKKLFEKFSFSKRTVAARKSHLRKVRFLLRREFPELRPRRWSGILKVGYMPFKIKRVAAALMAEGIASSAN